MPNFKDAVNGLHFLSDEDIANGGASLLPAACIQIIDEEAARRLAPTTDQIKAARIASIDAELAAIDANGARPSRDIAAALAAGSTAPAAAVQKLIDLDAQAGPLRAERRTLTE